MRSNAFRPSVSAMESRLTPSHATIASATHSIDVAYTRFERQYQAEVAHVTKTGNQTVFQKELTTSVDHLRTEISKDAGKLPGSQALVAELESSVNQLSSSIDKTPSTDSASQIAANESLDVQEVQTYQSSKDPLSSSSDN